MSSKDMKKAALEYARQGWPIFPCKANKAPYTDSGVLEATTDQVQIADWWDQWPMANIGMDVGGAGMIAVDVDPGADWDSLEHIIGDLETQLVQRTPRGGDHLFFLKGQDEIVPPSASKVAPHVDIRSHHSYVLLAPSRTKDGSYHWESQGKPAYRSDTLVELATASFREQSADHDTWIIEPDLEENVSLAVQFLRECQVAVEGLNGDDMAYRTAAMMKSYGLSPETAFEVMWEFWNPRCSPPWSNDEYQHLQDKVLNAYRYNTSPPGNLSPAYRVAKQQALFKPVSRDTHTGGHEAKAGKFRFVDERGIESIRDPEWLVSDCITQGGYSLLVGPPGVGKSFVALDLALSISYGGAAWFDTPGDWTSPWADVQRGRVLYVAGEGRAGLKSRVHAWRSFHVDGEESGYFYLADPVPHPTDDDATAFIEGALALSKDGYALVVLDTVARSMQGLNENAQQDVSKFTLLVQTIQKELGCAVLALHHTGHGDNLRARGSSAFGGDIDTELVLSPLDKSKEGQTALLYMTKQKDYAEWAQPKLIQLNSYDNSLVSVAVSQKVERQVQDEQQSLVQGTKNTHRKGGRKKPKDVEIELSVIRTIAYQTMKKYPNKEWSRNALANAIAADEKVSVAAGTIRNRYLDELMTDKTHPVASCFDVGKNLWVFKK